jgi:uncharacterized protein YacL
MVTSNKNGNGNIPDSSQTQKPVAGLVWRIVFCVLFFILGFNLSMTAFFSELPGLGYHTVIEVLLSSAAGLFGYFVFPWLLAKAKYWIESVISQAINNIVASFWEQQSKRIQDARRKKQKARADAENELLKKEFETSVVLDTSVLVDGRIVDILKTGFFDSPLVISQNVIHELQTIADSKDPIKRQRGRRGRDVAREVKTRKSADAGDQVQRQGGG